MQDNEILDRNYDLKRDEQRKTFLIGSGTCWVSSRRKRIKEMNIEKLITYIPFKQCKNNHTAYYSNYCPFCKHKGKKNVRYNSKKKVCKAFCCGVSFKDLSWLNVILTDWDRYKVKQIEDEGTSETIFYREII